MRIFQVDLYIGYPLNLLGGKQDTGKQNLLKLFLCDILDWKFYHFRNFSDIINFKFDKEFCKKKKILNYICLAGSYFQSFNSRLW